MFSQFAPDVHPAGLVDQLGIENPVVVSAFSEKLKLLDPSKFTNGFPVLTDMSFVAPLLFVANPPWY